MKYKVLYGQTILDIAAMAGDASKANDIAVLNGLSLSDELIAGALIKLPDDFPTTFPFALGTLEILPTTGNEDGGIGIWAIESDFMVE